mmetsp:Transcript_104635/g.223647  ORF Transcript_104635/g.223647 Transcript_104635/m.223647 type:complete len:355 (-) Transcript_104635:51-1115(-)
MIKTPVNQKRLTNVATVRLKSHGKRFEIACYKNKVLNWREGIEKELDEVIQISTIFTNVSKGDVANVQDLKKAFGTTDSEEICRKILKSGELQVSDKEREVHAEGLLRDIVQIIVERCVHPTTGRQLTPLAVDNALKTVGFSVQTEHTAKKQALKAIETLCKEIPESFARAKMRLRIECPETLLEEIRRHLLEESHAQIEEETGGDGAGPRSIAFLCDPSCYRDLDSLATVTHKGEGVSLQVVTATVLREQGGDAATAATSAPFAPPQRSAGGSGGAPAPRQAVAAPQAPATRKGLRCSNCGVDFEDAAEYRQHCKSLWHNHNLKRKVKSLPPVSEEDFAEISLDMREGFLAAD